MPRYLPVTTIVELLQYPLGKITEEVAEEIGVPLAQAVKHQDQWFKKIHGRCTICGCEKCECKADRTGDNRDGWSVLAGHRDEILEKIEDLEAKIKRVRKKEREVALKKDLQVARWELNRYLETIVDHIECRACKEEKPYSIRNAIYRMERESDWEEFFRCKTCWNSRNKRSSKKTAKPDKKTKTVPAKDTEEVGKKRVVAKVKPQPKTKYFENKPFHGLELVEAS